LAVKIGLDCKKKKRKIKEHLPSSLFPKAQLHSFIPSSSASPPSSRGAVGWGMGS